jgi:endonuclease YncB( thermonuclease family)
VKVSDGDTLTVLVDKTQVRVRLDSIDAQESKKVLGVLQPDLQPELAGIGCYWAGSGRIPLPGKY